MEGKKSYWRCWYLFVF